MTSLGLQGGGTIVFHQSAAGDLDTVEILQNFVTFLENIFPGGKSGGRKLVLVLGKSGDRSSEAGEKVIELDPAAVRRFDLDELAKAGKAVLLHNKRCRYSSPMPRWLCGAFRNKHHASGGSERFLAGHRVFPHVESMLRKGALPEWKKILYQKSAADSYAENKLFDEYSRAMSLVLRRYGFKGELDEAEKFLEKILAENGYLQVLEKIVWNNWNHMPYEMCRKRIELLFMSEIPVVDQNGKITGESEKVPALQLGRKSAGHPERQRILSDFSAKIFSRIKEFPPVLRRVLRHVAVAAANAAKDPEKLRELDLALHQGEKEMKKMEQRELFLERCSGISPDLVKIMQPVMMENSAPGTALSPEGTAFLRECEKHYIR
ncbi:MAG: hypothetical protein IKA87_04060 [Lentisphaeria bacterium]|nr:hypothetical protein [Lentisphaeria bacterium]